MTQVIIYGIAMGGVAVIYPVPEVVEKYGIDAIAKKDVPNGLKYKIIDLSELPTDRSTRDAWTIEESDLTDGVGSESNEFEVK
jgi:hypothetical protein